MANRGLYTPALSDRNVRRLYRFKTELCARTGRTIAMTVVLNSILDAFFETVAPNVGAADLPSQIPTDGRTSIQRPN